MESFPLQLFLFGLVDRIAEPFCYGCGGFILGYRVTRSLTSKLVVIGIAVLSFLWMDDIWPAIVFRSASLAVASENRDVAEMFNEYEAVGRAEFRSGKKSGLWNIYRLSVWDIGSAFLFVPLGFYLGLVLTKRNWNEGTSRSRPPPTPPAIRNTLTPPPPPPNSSHECQ